MGKYNGAVITTAGEGIIAQALQGTKLTWTHMRTSSAVVAQSAIKSKTSLTSVEQTADISDATVYSSNIIQVSARFSNNGIATAYLIQTVGIYGQLEGGSETLIAIMTAETPDEMPVYDADAPSALSLPITWRYRTPRPSRWASTMRGRPPSASSRSRSTNPAATSATPRS